MKGAKLVSNNLRHSGVLVPCQDKTASLVQLILEYLTSHFRHLWESNIGVLAVNKLEFRTATFISQHQQGAFAIAKHFAVITVFSFKWQFSPLHSKCDFIYKELIIETRHWSWKVPLNLSSTTPHFTSKENEADRGQMTCLTSVSWALWNSQASWLLGQSSSQQATPAISYSKIPTYLTQKESLFLVTYLRAVPW